LFYFFNAVNLNASWAGFNYLGIDRGINRELTIKSATYGYYRSS